MITCIALRAYIYIYSANKCHVTWELTKGKSICCRFGFYGQRNEGYKVHYLIYTYLLFVSYYLLFCSAFAFVSLLPLNSHALSLFLWAFFSSLLLLVLFLSVYRYTNTNTHTNFWFSMDGFLFSVGRSLSLSTHSLYYIAFLCGTYKGWHFSWVLCVCVWAIYLVFCASCSCLCIAFNRFSERKIGVSLNQTLWLRNDCI